MGFLSMFGTMFGNLPDHMGRQFFVAPSASYTVAGRACSASDGNDGLSPERALLTVAQALSLCTASVGDVIILLPGAHTAAASLAMSKAGVTLMGLRRAGERGNPMVLGTSLTTSATDEVINITAASVEIAHLRIIPVSTKAGIDISSAGNSVYIHDCFFDLATPAVNTGTKSVAVLGAASNIIIENSIHIADGAQGPAIDMTASVDSIVRRNLFMNNAGTWAAAMLTGAATSGLLIDECTFQCYGTAMTVGIDGTGATIARGVFIQNCRFGELVTKGVDNYDANEATLSENYDAGVGATDGGVLVVAIT